jgi:hypothetical protein
MSDAPCLNICRLPEGQNRGARRTGHAAQLRRRFYRDIIGI